MGAPDDHPPRACILVTAPTNAQVANLIRRVIQSAEQDPAFMQDLLKDHPTPWMRLRAEPPRICETITSGESKRHSLTIRTAMAHLHVPSTGAVSSLQSRGWLLQDENCYLGGPQASHRPCMRSPSWMSPRGTASPWVSTWPLLGHSACFVRMPVSCAHIVPSLSWQLLLKSKKVTSDQIAWPKKDHFSNVNVDIH